MDERRTSWDKVVLPVAVAVLGALLVIVLTPLGNGIRELLFPTRVTVTGTVSITGASLTGLRVALDGGEPLDGDGGFRIPDVRAGEHRLELTSAGSQPLTHEFQVAQGAGPELDLGEIELPALVRMGYFEVPVAPERVVDYDFTVWLVGDPAALGRVTAVTYTLPPPFSPAQAGGAGPQQLFCYRQTGSVAFEQLPPGGNPFTAVVSLADGASFQVATLSTPVGGEQPPPCPALTSEETPAPPPAPVPAPVPAPSPTPDETPSEEVQLTVPDVRGLSVGEARSVLEATCTTAPCFTTTVSTEPSATDPGTVIRQEPAAGAELPRGAPVALVVSAGPSPSETSGSEVAQRPRAASGGLRWGWTSWGRGA